MHSEPRDPDDKPDVVVTRADALRRMHSAVDQANACRLPQPPPVEQPRACSSVGCTVTGPDVRLYLGGLLCDPHSPWARAGRERPGRTAYQLRRPR